MKSVNSFLKGFTLMELLVVVAVLAVLTAIVAAAVIGVKSTGTDGQVKSDAKATQIALDNYNNKSIKARQFPEAQLDLVVSTAGASNFHINADVAGLGSGDGRSVLLVGEDGRGETLADKLTPFGKTTGDAVFKRRLIEFGSATDTWDTSGAVKTSSFVPHFLLKKPTSLILKGDETKDLGAANNVFEEYLWLLQANAPGTNGESRTVQVYRLSAARCAGPVSSPARPQPDPPPIPASIVSILKGSATGCDDSNDTVKGLIYDAVFGVGRSSVAGGNPVRIAFTTNRDGNFEIYVMNDDRTNQTRLTDNPATDGEPAWSPEGSKIAFTSVRDGNYQIYVMNADGTNETRITNNSADEFYPAWSPDGSKIAFVSHRDGNFEIYVMNADGTNQTRLTNNAAADNYPDWSPSVNKITFTSDRDGVGNEEIYVMNADGTNVTRITNSAADDFSPAWSPDGSKIAFTSARDGNLEIYVMNADGTDQTRLTNNLAIDVVPSWSPDGSVIAFESDRDGDSEIYIMNADGTNPSNHTNNPAEDGEPDWSHGPVPP